MKLPTAVAAQKGPCWIASALSKPGHSVDGWRADRGVVDMNSLRYQLRLQEVERTLRRAADSGAEGLTTARNVIEGNLLHVKLRSLQLWGRELFMHTHLGCVAQADRL